MKRRDYMKERAYQDFMDSLKSKCPRCGKYKILEKEGYCHDCLNDDSFGVYSEIQK